MVLREVEAIKMQDTAWHLTSLDPHIPPWMEKRLCWRWSFLLTSSWIKWSIHQKAMWVCLKTRKPKHTLENEKTVSRKPIDLRTPPETQPCPCFSHQPSSPSFALGSTRRREASMPAFNRRSRNIDACKRKPCRKHHIISHPTCLFLVPFKTKSSNIKLPTFTKVLTSAPCFSQGLGPKLFRLVKLFFHQPTQRTRHFQCRNFRRFLVLLLILSTSLIQVLSNVGKDFFATKKNLSPMNCVKVGFPKYTSWSLTHDITPWKREKGNEVLPKVLEVFFQPSSHHLFQWKKWSNPNRFAEGSNVPTLVHPTPKKKNLSFLTCQSVQISPSRPLFQLQAKISKNLLLHLSPSSHDHNSITTRCHKDCHRRLLREFPAQNPILGKLKSCRIWKETQLNSYWTLTLLGTNISSEEKKRHFWRWFSFSPGRIYYSSSMENNHMLSCWIPFLSCQKIVFHSGISSETGTVSMLVFLLPLYNCLETRTILRQENMFSRQPSHLIHGKKDLGTQSPSINTSYVHPYTPGAVGPS